MKAIFMLVIGIGMFTFSAEAKTTKHSKHRTHHSHHIKKKHRHHALKADYVKPAPYKSAKYVSETISTGMLTDENDVRP